MTTTAPRRESSIRKGWRVPAGLIMLGFIPVLAGAFRLTQLGSGAEITPDNERFFASPGPVVVHGALSGLWLTLFYPRPDNVGDLLTAIRLVVGSAWILFLVLGFTAIRRRDFARHRVWMIRAYAIAMGAGTQAVTLVPWILAVGELDKLSNALAMFAGWAINVAVAEWIIRRRLSRPARNSLAWGVFRKCAEVGQSLARAAATRRPGQGEERALPAGVVSQPPTPSNHPPRPATTQAT